MRDCPVVTFQAFLYNFVHYIGSLAASLERALSLLHQSDTIPPKDNGALSRSFAFIFSQEKMNVRGMKYPEELTQQTTVIVYPRSPLTILLTDRFPLELLTVGFFVGTALAKYPLCSHKQSVNSRIPKVSATCLLLSPC
jgi:hypothetical protein